MSLALKSSANIANTRPIQGQFNTGALEISSHLHLLSLSYLRKHSKPALTSSYAHADCFKLDSKAIPHLLDPPTCPTLLP